VINDPDSDDGDEALLRIVNVPVRYVSNKIKDQLKGYCRERGIHLYAGFEVNVYPLAYVRKNIKQLVAFMDPLIEDVETKEPVQVIQQIRSTWDYDRFHCR
jgi:DNA helicase-2/ATP-dependent DNA helicase PcrA